MTLLKADDLAKKIISTNGKLIINVSPDAVGHALAETDNFLRMKLTGEYDKDRPSYFYNFDFGDRLLTMQRLFGDLIFDTWDVGPHGCFLGTVVANAYPDLIVDVGISSFKVAMPRGEEPFAWEPNGFYRTSYFYDSTLMYHKRFAATSDVYPFIDKIQCSDEIEDFIGAKGGKVSAVQFKDVSSAGIAFPLPAEHYIPALSFLMDNGYTIVLVGREAMPREWERFGVVNYAGSRLATFENDFRLMKRATVGIVGASGIQLFLELLDKPFIQINTKMPAMPPWGRKSICAPSLYRFNGDGGIPSFLEHLQYNIQNKLYYDTNILTPFPPTPRQILNATREMVELENNPGLPLTERQKKYRSLDPHGCVGISATRMSDSFLIDHENLL